MATPVGSTVQFFPVSGSGGARLAGIIAGGRNDDAALIVVFPPQGGSFVATDVVSRATWITLANSNPAAAAATPSWQLPA